MSATPIRSNLLPDDWLMVSATTFDVGMRLARYAQLSLEGNDVAKQLLPAAVADVNAAAAKMREDHPAALAPSDGLDFVSSAWVRSTDQLADVLHEAMKRDRGLAEDFAVDLGDWDLCVSAAPELRGLVGKHSLAFNEAVRGIIETSERFAAGRLSSLDHSRAREAWLEKALVALADEYGVRLAQPLHIDSRGEFKLVALHPDGRIPDMGCGPFGDFAAALNRHSPRCGVSPGAVLAPENGWCYLNHFDACNLVTKQYEAARLRVSTQAAPTDTPAPAAPATRRKARP
jgi:hypothetical protein